MKVIACMDCGDVVVPRAAGESSCLCGRHQIASVPGTYPPVIHVRDSKGARDSAFVIRVDNRLLGPEDTSPELVARLQATQASPDFRDCGTLVIKSSVENAPFVEWAD